MFLNVVDNVRSDRCRTRSDEPLNLSLETEMLKNRFMTAFACAGIIGLAACASEDEGVQFDEGATFEEPATQPELAPPPVTQDTMLMPPMDDTSAIDLEADTGADAGLDTGADPVNDPTM